MLLIHYSFPDMSCKLLFAYPALPSILVVVPLQMHGEITYNGHTFQDFIPQMTAAYITQTDTHLPELTVRETFDFAVRAQGTGHKAGD